MKTLKIVFVILVTISVLATAAFFLVGYLKPKPAGIMIDSTPVSSVYINGSFVGKTPYKSTFPAGEISIRLVPGTNDQNLVPYETKVNLDAGIQTVVRREFNTTEETSSEDVISFDKIGGNSAGLVVISTPDNSQVLIDGMAQGFSPYNMNSITVGSHQITVRAVGYMDRTMEVKTQSGYRLTVFAKLAKSQEALTTPIPSPTPKAETKSYVIIGNTPTGFLRMRTLPATSGEEIAELATGSKYLFLEADLVSGWYKIQYEDPKPGLPNGITGWVSNQYSIVATESATIFH